MTRTLFGSLALLCACSSGPEHDPPPSTPVELQVVEPARGTVVTDADRVWVRGRVAVQGASVPLVTIEDKQIPVAADGSFEREVEISAGLTLLDIAAKGEDGREMRDIRAVLSGASAAQGAPIERALAVQVERSFLDGIARYSSEYLKEDGFAIALTGDTFGGDEEEEDPFPVQGGAEVVGVALDSLDIAIAPTEGALAVSAEVRKLQLSLRMNLPFFPGGGSNQAVFSVERARIKLDIGVNVADGRIALEVKNVQPEISGGVLSALSFPADIAGAVETSLDEKLGERLAGAIAEHVQGTIQPMLEGLTAGTFSTDALGMRAELRLEPTEVSIDSKQARLAAQVTATFPDHADIAVPYTPVSPPWTAPVPDGPGLKVGVADDVINQYLTVLWASGSLDQQAPLADTVLGEFGNIDRLEFRLALPPHVRTLSDGSTRVTVGDVFVDVIDEAGNLVANLVVSGSVSLAVAVATDGQLQVVTQNPELWISLLGEDGVSAGSTALGPGLAASVMETLEPLLNDAINGAPSLRLRDIALLSPTLDAAPGYLLLGADFHFGGEATPEPPDGWDSGDRFEEDPPDGGVFGCSAAPRSASGTLAVLALLCAAVLVGRRSRAR